ncbi:MAG: ubiquinol-cytochrome C chaperone [Alphaproteobacteria bacterium]|nr:MAG: ubiquinol-cytochrome C chaperone [Alphaproteobacteria bacterium]
MFSIAITKRQRQLRDAAFDLYCKSVDQARNEYLYSECQVPDTVDGRFDLIVLHLFIIIHATQKFSDRNSADLQQKLFDTLFWDMDRNLREMGAGDLGVPRRIKAMMLAFNGRCHAYAEALQTGNNEALIGALLKNVYRDDKTVNRASVEKLALYLQAQLAHLKAFNSADFWDGTAQFQPFPQKLA